MKDQTDSHDIETNYNGDTERAVGPVQPLIRPNSGLYEWSLSLTHPQPTPIPVVPHLPVGPGDPLQPGGGASGAEEATDEFAGLQSAALTTQREELRLDVDGYFPQHAASGTISGFKIKPINWIAKLKNTGANTYAGSIWYKDGNTAAFPYTKVQITVTKAIFPTSATVKFSGGGATLTRTYQYKSPYFRKVEFECDHAQGVSNVTSFNTGSHPNRPASLPVETLTLEKIYRRAGFQVHTTAGNTVPISLAGANARWSDSEMHDAMQVYWSHFANKAQWSFWTLFASLHEQGSSLGGIMFDDIGPNERQGTSIFVDAFISQAPAGDPAPAAFVQRMRFWTAVHEMGHCFNLAHSWQKAMATSWIPLANEPEVRSFMNYPYNVAGGTTAFFSNFQYRFSDSELLFMRHAPERFVEMGNAAWFDHHGFEQANVSPEPSFALELRPARAGAAFEFLEPIVLDLKLTNTSDQPQLVEEKLLACAEDMTVIIKKRGKPAREHSPYARYCYQRKLRALQPGDSLTDSLFLSAGRNGFDLAEPGYYTIQIALHLEHEDIVSAPLTLRVEPPKSYDEEYLAQDFFSDDVGRFLAFDGSRVMDKAEGTLREITERLRNRRVAIHTRIALGNLAAQDYKQLELRETDPLLLQSAGSAGARVRPVAADLKEARSLLGVLVDQPKLAAESLGRVDFSYYVNRFRDCLGIKVVKQMAGELAEVAIERKKSGSLLTGHKKRSTKPVKSGKAA